MLTHDVPTRKFLPVLERQEPLIKDSTAVTTFKVCKRKYFYRFVLGRTAKESIYSSVFAFGSAVHKFNEIYSMTHDMEKALIAALPIYKPPKQNLPKFEHLTLTRFQETVRYMMKFFDEEKKQNYVKTIAVEQPFNFEFPDGNQGGGRFDAIIQYGGNSWVRDYKTTSKRIDYFRESLDPNDQATRYVYALSLAQGWTSTNSRIAAKASGVEFVAIQNLKPVEGKRKGTTPNLNPPKSEKILITRSNDQLVRFEQEQLMIHKTMDMYRQADIWPMEENNCSWCDYKQICRASTDDQRQYKLKTEFTYSPWDHQKVEQVTGEEG